VGLNLGVESLAESRIEEQVRDSGLDPRSVEVEIDSFPIITTLITDGRVERLVVAIRDFDHNGVHFSRLTLTFAGLKPKKAALLGGDPSVVSIQRGRLSAVATVEGPLAAAAELGEVPDGIVPCDPVDIEGSGSVLRLSCTMRPVPRGLLEEFGILG
jgi:hypothetical protein